MRKRNEKGFTLIEVVVVVAVIAILAAVLTPYITKYIDDSKIAKARNETQVIAAAVTNAYKDLGRWPNKGVGANPDFAVIYTGAVLPAGTFLAAAATGWTAPSAAAWDTLNNHLSQNQGNRYPVAGDTRWAGPYATQLPVDPWGRPYVINALNLTSVVVPPIPVWVLSAGPNGTIDTPIAAATIVPGGDDIGFRVR
jgi:prepilin-type N-terminal cleavage/methylation domain-containing protein